MKQRPMLKRKTWQAGKTRTVMLSRCRTRAIIKIREITRIRVVVIRIRVTTKTRVITKTITRTMVVIRHRDMTSPIQITTIIQMHIRKREAEIFLPLPFFLLKNTHRLVLKNKMKGRNYHGKGFNVIKRSL